MFNDFSLYLKDYTDIIKHLSCICSLLSDNFNFCPSSLRLSFFDGNKNYVISLASDSPQSAVLTKKRSNK